MQPDCSATLSLALAGDVASALQLHDQLGPNIIDFAGLNAVRIIVRHLLNAGYEITLHCRGEDRPLTMDNVLDPPDGRDCLTCTCHIVAPLYLPTALTWQSAKRFACDCAEHILHFFERQYPTETRPRTALARAREYATGAIDKEQLEADWTPISLMKIPYDTAAIALECIIEASEPRFSFASARDVTYLARSCVATEINMAYFGHVNLMIDGTPPPNYLQAKMEIQRADLIEKGWQFERFVMYALGEI